MIRIIAIILITHDLGVVAQTADRVAVMYAGKIAEIGTRHDIFYRPAHPYTKGLLRSVPRLDMEDSELSPIDGTPPDLFDPPPGCPFAARCPDRMIVCEKVYPATTVKSKSHIVNNHTDRPSLFHFNPPFSSAAVSCCFSRSAR